MSAFEEWELDCDLCAQGRRHLHCPSCEELINPPDHRSDMHWNAVEGLKRLVTMGIIHGWDHDAAGHKWHVWTEDARSAKRMRTGEVLRFIGWTDWSNRQDNPGEPD